MTPRHLVCAALAAAAALALGAAEKPKVSAYERSQGWRLVFDGRDTSDWRGYRADRLPANWEVRDEALAAAAGPALVSVAEYADFELQFDWRVTDGGRGAVHFRVSEDGAAPGDTGPRMVLVGAGDGLGGDGFRPADRRLTPQTGVWYRAKILVFGNAVEHWINNERVLVYTLDTPDWRKSVAASPGLSRDFGRLKSGQIALAGEGIEFRNIKVRSL